jgi:hypothetical protein
MSRQAASRAPAARPRPRTSQLAELRRLGRVHMIGTVTGRGRYPGRAVGIWRLAAAADEILLIGCAAAEMTPAHAGIVARIVMRSRSAPVT